MRLTRGEISHIITESLYEFAKNINAVPVEQPQNTETEEPDYDKVELFNDPKIPTGKEWAKTEGNFPIKRNGKIYYVSKSATASLAVLCFDRKRGVWCILANQRGPGAGGKCGLWNLPVGYVERNESAMAAAVRETFEETGVEIPKDTHIRNLGSNSGYSDKVSFAFSCVLKGSIEDYPLSDENSEPGEIADIKWIPVLTAGGSRLDNIVRKYRWDRDPVLIVDRAETAILPYLKRSFNTKELVDYLKSEIRSNPTAMYLLNKILASFGYKEK